MAGFSQSVFLQALGWATLNSFWQAGLLWLLFLIAETVVKPSAQNKYLMAVAAAGLTFAWFCVSFLFYLLNGQADRISFFELSASSAKNILPYILSAASLTYLGFLCLPAYLLLQNWQHMQALKKTGLSRPDGRHRLFIKKIGLLLGIKKPVQLYLSNYIPSPLTLGFLKPVILLPVAALNNLSTQQVEAILLHELSHIKRHDYLVNFMLSIVLTILYFNPFVRLFVRTAEAQREECCDQMVLQFGYDKVSYASALLSLEQASAQVEFFALGAAGKRYLLQRIEKIVGVKPQKRALNFSHITAFATAALCLFALNSFFISSRNQPDTGSPLVQQFANPFYLIEKDEGFMENENPQPAPPCLPPAPLAEGEMCDANDRSTIFYHEQIAKAKLTDPPAMSYIIPVSVSLANASLNKEQKEQVKMALSASKKVLFTLEWKEMETAMADALTREEKRMAKLEYLKEIEQVDWEKMENNLSIQFNEVNWPAVNRYLENALISVQMDSLHQVYTDILNQPEDAKPCILPLPDVTVKELEKKQNLMRSYLDSTKTARKKPVIRL